MARVALLAILATVAVAEKSAVDVLQDMFKTCLQDMSVSCVKPKALAWISEVFDKERILVTEDLVIMKKDGVVEEGRGLSGDILDKFEDFIQTHDLVIKAPEFLHEHGPRSFQPEDIRMPLAEEGRSSKIVKKVILPFLLGLKFKTAVLVPLALALIALKTWKALTLGLLSLVLTGALVIFKLTKPKSVNYEVIHVPQHVEHHVDHHVDHHVEHPPVAAGWDHPGYARKMGADELAYRAYL